MAEQTVSAAALGGLLDFAVAEGADRARLLALADIAPADLDDGDNRLPMPRYRALMRVAKQLSGNSALALHYAEQVDLSELSVVGLITQPAPSVQKCMCLHRRCISEKICIL